LYFSGSQKLAFYCFCSLQKSKNRRFDRFERYKRTKSVVLAFSKATKEQNQVF